MGNLKDNMEKYDKSHVGKALYNFVNGARVTKTKLGELSSSERGGNKDIIASGHQIFDINDYNLIESPITIYTKYTTISSAPILKNGFQEKLSVILQDYMNTTDLEKEIKEEIQDKLKLINKRKALIIPINPKSDCKITYSLDNVKESRVISKIKYLKWSTNKESYELECVAAFEVKSVNGDKIIKIPVTEYCISFMPDKLEYWNGIGNCTKSLISMTSTGLIKPIELTDGIQSIITDGTFVYWIHNGLTSVIGEWEIQSGALSISQDALKYIGNSKVWEFFKDNITLFSGHRRLIAPYNLCSLNKFDVRESTKKKEKEKK